MSAVPSPLPGHYRDAVLLCVDDDPWVLEVTSWILEKRGYKVLVAADGSEAIAVFSGNRVDLVVVDYEMPGMKGHEVASTIKSMNPRIPVVLHSGKSDLPEEALRAADAFVPKGEDFDLLVNEISNLLYRSRNSDAGMASDS
jgi:CheY-like chemotaxis protein